MSGNSWGESWGITGAFVWGDSWGFEGFVAVTPPPSIPPGGGDVGHRGSLYWKRYQEELRRLKQGAPKKKRELLDDLDDMLLELRERVQDAAPEVEAEYFAPPDFSVLTQPIADVTMTDIRRQIAAVKEAIEEIDDEETFLLTLH